MILLFALAMGVAAYLGVELWIAHFNAAEVEWNGALLASAKSREAAVKSTIANDPLGILRGVLAVVGVIVQIIIAAL